MPSTSVLDSYLKNKEYADSRYDDLLEDYDGKYVAVNGGRVIAVADTVEDLRAEIARSSLLPLEPGTAVVYVTRETTSMLL